MSKSRKRLDDLEYNVYKNSSDISDRDAMESGKGCITVVAGLIVTAIIVFLIAGVLKGNSGSAVNCAYPGCGKTPAMGSNYCWQHNASYSSNRRKRSASSERDKKQETDGGSIMDGGSSSADYYSSRSERNTNSSSSSAVSGDTNP